MTVAFSDYSIFRFLLPRGAIHFPLPRASPHDGFDPNPQRAGHRFGIEASRSRQDKHDDGYLQPRYCRGGRAGQRVPRRRDAPAHAEKGKLSAKDGRPHKGATIFCAPRVRQKTWSLSEFSRACAPNVRQEQIHHFYFPRLCCKNTRFLIENGCFSGCGGRT